MPDEQESKKRKAEDSPEAEEINAVDSQAKLAIMVEDTKVHDANEHHEGASSPKVLPVVEEAEDPIIPVDNADNKNHVEPAKGAPKDSESEKIDAPSMDCVTNGETEQKDEDDNPYSKMRRCIVQNDGKEENMIRLIGLKNLFSKQLPKMPKEYIVRLVLDRRHKSLAILSDDPKVMVTDEEIIGGICYRAYHDMRFAEIAFCAVNQAQQVKGYGTKLMNLLKMHAATEGVEYFITYADNYATGYFKKQGFTRVSFLNLMVNVHRHLCDSIITHQFPLDNHDAKIKISWAHQRL
jgi:histone acetyltransferase